MSQRYHQQWHVSSFLLCGRYDGYEQSLESAAAHIAEGEGDLKKRTLLSGSVGSSKHRQRFKNNLKVVSNCHPCPMKCFKCKNSRLCGDGTCCIGLASPIFVRLVSQVRIIVTGWPPVCSASSTGFLILS